MLDRRRVVLDSALADAASNLAFELADRLIDPAQTTAHGESAADSNRGLGGESGMALFFSAVSQASDDPKYRTALHAYMKRAAQGYGNAPGLFSGVDGVFAAACYASVAEPRYRAFAERCAQTLCELDEQTEAAFKRPRLMYDYDVIGGAAGKALASSDPAGIGVVDAARVRRMCDYLVWLLDDHARWMCPHPRFLNGAAWNDLGMAHGVAGMVAVLSFVAPEEERYVRAIRVGCDFMMANRYPGERLDWPASVSAGATQPSRSGWCYGGPGNAAALLAAARRLNDAGLENQAMKALRDLCTCAVEEWRMGDYALCHGFAGNALIFLRAGISSGDALLLETAQNVIRRVIDAYDPSLSFGYLPENDPTALNSATLLTGSAGIALMLLTATGQCDPSWVRYFGLA